MGSVLNITVEEVLTSTLLVCLAGVLGSFLWATRKGGRYEQFHALQLITTRDGRLDRPALMEVVIWVLMCWGFVIFLKRDSASSCTTPSLPEWYVQILVGAFVLRAAYSAWLKSRGGESSKDRGREDHRYGPDPVGRRDSGRGGGRNLPDVPPPRERTPNEP